MGVTSATQWGDDVNPQTRYMVASRELERAVQVHGQVIDAIEAARPQEARDRWETTPDLHQALLVATRAKRDAERTFQEAWKIAVSGWLCDGQSAVLHTDRSPDRGTGYDVVGDKRYLGRTLLPGKASTLGLPSRIVLIRLIPAPGLWVVIGRDLKPVYGARVIYADPNADDRLDTVLQVWQDARWMDCGVSPPAMRCLLNRHLA
jgi:hypothetical protein